MRKRGTFGDKQGVDIEQWDDFSIIGKFVGQILGLF